jgi:hypothetical protein
MEHIKIKSIWQKKYMIATLLQPLIGGAPLELLHIFCTPTSILHQKKKGFFF